LAPSPADFLPLPARDFQVLLALTEGPRHAYRLTQAVESPGAGVRLELGSLYRILARLAAAGVIAEDAGPPPSDAREARRRYYRLTAFGRRVADAETARLQAVVRLALRRRLAAGRTRS